MDLDIIIAEILSIKAANGHIKPKYGSNAYIRIGIMILFIILSIGLLIFGLINLNIELIIGGLLFSFCFGYLFLISPYTQNPKDYIIDFETAASLNNFKLYYKNKLVDVKYRIDSKGKIAFLNNKNKLSCISYADGSNMSTLTKYKIINYFAKCLNDGNIMSDEITTTFEGI